MPETDTLAQLRKLAGPDQTAALRTDCRVIGNRIAQLGAANAEHWLRLSEAQGRIDAGQLAATQALDVIEQNTEEREALPSSTPPIARAIVYLACRVGESPMTGQAGAQS